MSVVELVHKLDRVPWWILYTVGPVLLYGLFVQLVVEIRGLFEHKRYNVALSSKYGDAALIGVIFLCIHAVRGGESNVVLESEKWVAIAALFSLVIGIMQALRGGEVGDVYHNLFVMPLLTVLLICLAPVWFEMSEERSWFVFIAFVLWGGCLLIDISECRLDQKVYLIKRGEYPVKKTETVLDPSS